ncbi:MAG: transcriptional repressor [Prevotella sp.]|jgi:Fur family peroxide stress response transcriptional regulator|nr:transcriptional repressor [Prevotella sp.]MCI1281636.1 transcriptional repressor [Prevotella sp.]
MKEQEAYKKLVDNGVRPSVQRLAIMEYLLTHFTHPTVEDVYQGLCNKIPTLSRTTVYNTLRLFSEHQAAQMITIDDHRVCYDGNTSPHVHFFCKQCGKVIDLFGEKAPMPNSRLIDGNFVDEVQLYYKGICSDCKKKSDKQKH